MEENLEDFLMDTLKEHLSKKKTIDSKIPEEELSIYFCQNMAIADTLLDACHDINYKGLSTVYLGLIKENKNFEYKKENLGNYLDENLQLLSSLIPLGSLFGVIASSFLWLLNPPLALTLGITSLPYFLFSAFADSFSTVKTHKKLSGTEYELNPSARGEDGEYRHSAKLIAFSNSLGGLLGFGLPILGFVWGTYKYYCSISNFKFTNDMLKNIKGFLEKFKKYKNELF